MFEKEDYRKEIEEIGEDYCPHHSYCIFKEFLVSLHPNRRMLVQLSCIDKLKFIKSKEAGKDVGWEIAFNAWITEGHAERFSKAYEEKKSVKKIFEQTVEGFNGQGKS